MDSFSKILVRLLKLILVMLLLFSPERVFAESIGTAINYQGQLMENGAPASGIFDFQFTIFDAVESGSQLGTSVLAEDIVVDDGLFQADLDFGAGVFSGEARWLAVEVRSGESSGTFTMLLPRQRILPSPYSIKANEESIFSKMLTGTVTVAPGSTTVIGTDTFFTSEVRVGDALAIEDETFNILSILNDEELELNIPHTVGAFSVIAATDGPLLDLSDGNNRQKMVVDRTGRVGIGTSNPKSELDVAGRIRVDCSICLGWGDVFSATPTRQQCFDLNDSGRDDSNFLPMGGVVDTNDRFWLWMECP